MLFILLVSPLGYIREMMQNIEYKKKYANEVINKKDSNTKARHQKSFELINTREGEEEKER